MINVLEEGPEQRLCRIVVKFSVRTDALQQVVLAMLSGSVSTVPVKYSIQRTI